MENNQSNVPRLPKLKLNEFEMWRIMIEQYFLMSDYALWEVILNGDSFKPQSKTEKIGDKDVTTVSVPTTTDERTQRKNDLKARSSLLMTLPKDQIIAFTKFKTAKELFEEICSVFGGNDATKKTQKTLLKQSYENFSASSNESLDSIFTKLQKLVTQLTVFGIEVEREDLNLKFLRSLPAEFHTNVTVWENKPEIETMKLNDLYNNFKLIEQRLKKAGKLGSSSSSLALMSTSIDTDDSEADSDDEFATAGSTVFTGNALVTTAGSKKKVAGIGDPTFYAFISTQVNGSILTHEDIEQIDDDDLEEMDIKWQIALLSMRARKFFKKTGKPIHINGSETAGFDKKKVECFNCHKLGHFARECRRPRKQDNRSTWYKQKKEPTVEEPKAMLAIDGVSYDWSFMADVDEEQSTEAGFIATEHALMALSDSEVQNFENCSKTCRATRECERLNELCESQRTELFAANYTVSNLRRGISVLEKQLEHYRENESKFSDDMIVIKRELDHKIAVNEALKEEVERLKKVNENVNLSVDTLFYQSKSIEKIWDAQITNKAKSGLGYNTVPPPLRGVPAPPGIDLAHTGIEDFQEPILEYGPPKFVKSEVEIKQDTDVFESASDSSVIDENVKNSVEKPIPQVVNTNTEEARKQVNKPRQTVKYAEMYRKRSSTPRGNQRSWNHVKSQQLGSDFVMNNKACYTCGDFNHLHAKCGSNGGRREFYGKNRVTTNKFHNQTHPNSHSNMIPRAVLLKSGPQSFSTAKTVNTAFTKSSVSSAKPKTTFVKSAQTDKSSLYNKKAQPKQQWVPKSTQAVSTATSNVPTVNVVNKKKGNMGNAVKASARWEWKPKGINTTTNPNGVSMTFDRFNYIDTRGRSKSIMAWVSKRN